MLFLITLMVLLPQLIRLPLLTSFVSPASKQVHNRENTEIMETKARSFGASKAFHINV